MPEGHAGSAPEVTLRGYVRSDLPAMFRLDVLCFEETFRFSANAMRRFAESRKAHVLIAAAGEELAGFYIVHRERADEGSFAYLLTLDVAPSFRRRGLARRLLEAAECQAHRAGCMAMLLHVFTENIGAQRLYEKLAYTRSGLETNFYGVGLHAWAYRKQLLS